MKAFLNVNLVSFMLGGVTLALAAIFWMPVGQDRHDSTTYVKMEGKTLALQTDQARVSAPAKPAALPEAQSLMGKVKDAELPNTEIKTKTSKERRKGRKPKMARRQQLNPTAVSTNTASSPALSGPLDSSQDYKLQKIVDAFEADPSKYPMEAAAKNEGITLTLVALERLDKMFVLKVAMANDTSSDFFIRDFTAQVSSTTLESQSICHILVESQRTREGYVIFSKPRSGAVVHIKLKEDGGKGRVVELPIPYPF